MMNALALGLLLTSLVTAGFFSPSPEKENPKEAVIVKEGHRVVVVEYEKDDGNTKVSISPKDEKGFANGAKDKLSEKTEDVKERVKEASSSVGDEVEYIHNKFSPTELVCDAYGKCKRLITGAMGKTKEAAADRVYEVEEEAKVAVGEAIGKVKDTATDASHKAFDKVQEAKEYVKDSANEVSSKAKDQLAGKTSEIKEGVKEVPERTKRQVQNAIEATKKLKEEAEKDARIKMEGYKENVMEKGKEAEKRVEDASKRGKHSAIKAKKEGRKRLSEILWRARDVGANVLHYVASLGGVAHLMGFAAAYGMCVWVTFASSYVLAGALPRHQFAMVQSKIYAVYFKAMAYGLGMALLGHLMSYRKPGVGMFQSFNLAAALVMTLVNLLFLEPRATKVMLERMKKEKEEGIRVVEDKDSTAEIAGRGTIGSQAATEAEIIGLSARLQRLNSYSSFLNVLTLMLLTWHLVHLGGSFCM